jgi:hypothetical protein
MSENELSILEWLKRIIKNPRIWLKRAKKGDSKPSAHSDFHIEEGNNPPETNGIPQIEKPGESGMDIELVQVDVSIIIPTGSSIHLDVSTAIENDRPHGVVEASPKVDKLWIDVYPSSGERNLHDADNGRILPLPSRHTERQMTLKSCMRTIT